MRHQIRQVYKAKNPTGEIDSFFLLKYSDEMPRILVLEGEEPFVYVMDDDRIEDEYVLDSSRDPELVLKEYEARL